MVNNVKTIYTTLDRGRIHIAADENYIGSVNTYNHFITRFFARLFRLAIQIDFDGKSRWVNKRSYKKLLAQMNAPDKQISNLRDRHLFKEQVPEGFESSKRMRNFISHDKKQELFRKLAYAIQDNEYEKAKKFIGKGAALNRKYYCRSFYKDGRKREELAFSEILEGLYTGQSWNLEVFEGTPLHYLAKKNKDILKKKSLYDHLIRFGAATDKKCEQYLYKGRRAGLDFPSEEFKQIINYQKTVIEKFQLDERIYSLKEVIRAV